VKILILTQYFPPEVGAPQNRLYELAVRLKQKGADISVLTAMPNYPQMEIHKEYKGKFLFYEELGGLKVYRSWIYVTKSKSIIPRLINYLSFVKTSFWSGWFRLGKFDYILCESPPLFLGISAYALCKIKGAKLIFNVSDLWPESAEKLGIVTNRFFLSLAYRLEKFLYRKSAIVTGQTQGIVKDISRRFPKTITYWLPNGADLDYFKPEDIKTEWRAKNNFSETDFILLYAGILGHAQGLEVIIQAAEILKEKKEIKFVLLGSGPEKEKLTSLAKDKKLSNVHFADTISKKSMPEVIKACNAAIIPLRKLDLFKGAIPSKIFEALAMKKPILLGVDGEAKELFIDEGKCGLFFQPENAKDLSDQILKLVADKDLVTFLGERGRKYVDQKFNRDKIAEDFWSFLTTTQSH
jgi:glycosyltransferase involved in cell wall biosynthesis